MKILKVLFWQKCNAYLCNFVNRHILLIKKHTYQLAVESRFTHLGKTIFKVICKLHISQGNVS